MLSFSLAGYAILCQIPNSLSIDFLPYRFFFSPSILFFSPPIPDTYFNTLLWVLCDDKDKAIIQWSGAWNRMNRNQGIRERVFIFSIIIVSLVKRTRRNDFSFSSQYSQFIHESHFGKYFVQKPHVRRLLPPTTPHTLPVLIYWSVFWVSEKHNSDSDWPTQSRFKWWMK